MKIKEGYILQRIAGENIVIAADDELDANMMISLNDSGRFLWEQLQEETTQEQLVEALLGEYEIDKATAVRAAAGFVDRLRENDLLA